MPPVTDHQARAPAQCWLDLLPIEVCRLIASCLPIRTGSDVALPLAETSTHLCAAVKAALNHSVVFRDIALVERWCEILGDDVWSVDVAHVATHDLVPTLLQSGNLRRARIYGDDRSLRAVKHSKSLRELVVHSGGHRKGVDVETFVEAFAEAVGSLQLERFESDCCAWLSDRRCPFGLSLLAMEKSEFAGDLACVRVVDIDCQELGTRLHWEVMALFEELREVTLYARLPLDDEEVERLGGLEVVHLKRLSICDLDVVSRIGDSVSTVEFSSRYDNCLTAQHLEQLGACTRLAVLKACLKHGAEKGLLAISKQLRSIELRWEWMFTGVEPLSRIAYAPAPGVIFQFIRSASCLTALRLFHVRIAPDELVDILMAIGPRLRDFGMSPFGQGELPAERLAFVMEQLAMHNSRVERFYAVDLKESGSIQTGCTSSHIRRLRASFSVLRRRAPFVETGCIEQVIAECERSR